MSEQVVDVSRILKVYGDRVLVRRMGEPEKKRGILVPQAYLAGRKEPKKVWWGKLALVGSESEAVSKHRLSEEDLVGIEPLGNHYAGFTGTDGYRYVWVPDEHLCLADEGSAEDYYLDRLDRKSVPRLRVLGDRLLVREITDEETNTSRLHRPSMGDDERDVRLAEVLKLGQFDCERNVDPVAIGDRIAHVSADSGSSAQVDIFDPPLVVVRSCDLIAVFEKEKVALA